MIDLGCGTGANGVFLASRGHDVTAIDFSSIALRKAGVRARRAGVQSRCRFLEADLTGVPLREMQRAARHAKADTTVRYDQTERSFHRDPTYVLMAATAR